MQSRAIVQPTVENVKSACLEFDRANEASEEAVSELFGLFPTNNNLPHVLLKVVVLNRLYSTQIFNVYIVARHIYERAESIDAEMMVGSPAIVDEIAWMTHPESGKRRRNYSFATKFCSWHNREFYPIWDSRVDQYLWMLNKTSSFTKHLVVRDDLVDYPTFCKIISDFRDHYKLTGLTLKQIDKFMWWQGELQQTAVPSSA